MDTSIVKRIRVIFLSLTFCLPVLIAAAQDEAKTPIIESISVLVGSAEPEQVVFRLSGSHTPKAFRIDGDRPRLVFDFYGINYPEGVKRISDVGGKIISGLRVGMHTDPLKTRAVVDIRKDTPYQYDYSFNVSTRSLVVTLTPDAEISSVREEPAEDPVHLGFEQLKIVYDSAAEEAQPDDARMEMVETEENRQQADDTNQAVASIRADSIKKMVTAEPAGAKPQDAETQEAEPQVAEPAEPAGNLEPDVDTETAVSPAATEKRQPAPVEPGVQETAEDATEAQPAEDQSVESVLLDVSFEKSINDSETVLFRLSHFSPPLVFGIEKGEPRVVCDFMGAAVNAGVPELIETNGQFINRITIARQTDPDKVRVELVLVPNRHYDLQQLFFKEESLFVVIVKELQKEAAPSN